MLGVKAESLRGTESLGLELRIPDNLSNICFQNVSMKFINKDFDFERVLLKRNNAYSSIFVKLEVTFSLSVGSDVHTYVCSKKNLFAYPSQEVTYNHTQYDV